MSEDELSDALSVVADPNLRLSLAFGIGLHHAGLTDGDRRLVESLFVSRKVQVLVATSTLAWGVNTPTHLVVIKGTEYFDARKGRYVDMPITDVLQMMGRAGRPQFDESGKAVIFVQDIKKNFYRKFLYEPFPVESSLHTQLHDHINAEVRQYDDTSVCANKRTIDCRRDADQSTGRMRLSHVDVLLSTARRQPVLLRPRLDRPRRRRAPFESRD